MNTHINITLVQFLLFCLKVFFFIFFFISFYSCLFNTQSNSHILECILFSGLPVIHSNYGLLNNIQQNHHAAFVGHSMDFFLDAVCLERRVRDANVYILEMKAIVLLFHFLPFICLCPLTRRVLFISLFTISFFTIFTELRNAKDFNLFFQHQKLDCSFRNERIYFLL